MGNRNGKIKKRKKTIKKPKFLSELLKFFAVFMSICFVAALITLEMYKRETAVIMNNRQTEYRNKISKCLIDYLNADYPDKDKFYNRLEYSLTEFAVVTKEYCAIYFGDDKFTETPSGYLIAADISEDRDNPHYIFLEDDLYLTPLSLYEKGKYDPVKSAARNYSLDYCRDLDYDAMRLGLLPAAYECLYETVYIDYDTDRFLPGEVAVSNWDHRNIVATVQCAPPKSVSYTEFDFDERYAVKGMSGNKTEDDIYIWYYEDEITPFELDVVDNSYKFWEFPWSIRTSYTDYNKVSVFTYLPWTCVFVIGIAAVAAFVIALVAAVISYNHKKTIWEIFEYRTKTTAAMAHDLKTPLAAMAAYAENLEYDVNTEKRAYYSSRIRENIDYMSKTVEGILDFSKSETGSVKAEIAEIDVRDLIQKEVEAADELFARLEINVEIKGEGKVKSDRELLEQATRNLIGNVAKYARARTKVDIEIGKEGFTITNLTDQKIKDASKLKEPFVKGEESRGSENGSGLGLSIADNCLAAAGHKLDIKVEGDKFIAGVRW